MGREQVIRAEDGPLIAPGRGRRCGPIRSALHPIAGEASATLGADFDCCFLGELPVTTLAAWREHLAAGRLAEVEGAFALAWSEPDGTLCLARDGLGERTLFYADTPRGLAYGPTVGEVLRCAGIEPRMLLTAIATYLTYAYLPGRETLARGVHEVLPGEIVRYRAGRMERGAFWRLPADTPCPADEATLAAELRRRLERAVRRRLPAPGETAGCTLSGGLDSSLVTALAARLHDGPVATYSVSFGAGHANELAFSSLLARHCRTDHTILELSPSVVAGALDATVALLGDPIGDPLTVPNALLFREAARATPIVLNGEGGDPCFGGPKNQPMLLAELYGGGEPCFSREAAYLRSHLKCYDDLADMLTPAMTEALAERPLESELARLLAEQPGTDPVARLQALNIRIKGGHHILPKVDALSAPFGVVPRAPLFDRAVVELSLAIPAPLKLKGSVEKHILKRAVSDLLPEAIIARPKSGMLVPVEAWCRGPLLAMARERLLDGLAPLGVVRREWLERLLAGRLGGLRPRHGAKIWLLLTLEAWLRRVLGPAARPP